MLADAIAYLLDPSSWGGSNGLGVQLVQQTLLTITSLGIVAAFGLPVALWLGPLGKGGTFAINVSNVGRAIPVFAVLGLLSVGFLGSGEFGPYGRAGLATLVSLVLFGLPPVITNAYVGMREIDADVIESARGMGMAEWRLFRQVELPLVMPLVMTGIRIALVQVWATATIAALVAGPGLGNTITYGFSNGRYELVLAGAILVAVIALLLEGVFAYIERAVDPMRRIYRQDAAAQSTTSMNRKGVRL